MRHNNYNPRKQNSKTHYRTPKWFIKKNTVNPNKQKKRNKSNSRIAKHKQGSVKFCPDGTNNNKNH